MRDVDLPYIYQKQRFKVHESVFAVPNVPINLQRDPSTLDLQCGLDIMAQKEAEPKHDVNCQPASLVRQLALTNLGSGRRRGSVPLPGPIFNS